MSHFISICKIINCRLCLKAFIQIICLFLFVLSIQASETSDYVHYRLGVKYKNEKKLDQAVEEFRKVLAAYPDNYNTYMHLAEIRDFQGRYRLSIYNLKKAMAYNPGWGKAHKMLAGIYTKDGQYQNALKELQDYHQACDPAERDSIQSEIDRLLDMVRYGRSRQGEKGKALQQKEGIDVKTEGVSADERLAFAKTSKPSKGPGRKKIPIRNAVAEKEFNLGVKAYSDGASSNNRQLLDKAVTHFRNTLKLQPGHTGAYYYAGLIRRRNGQNKMAKINFEKAISYPELGYNAHFYLGKIYGEEKSYKEAIRHLKLYLSKTTYEPGKREAQSLMDRYAAAYNALHTDTLKVDIKALGEEEMHREISKIPQETAYTPLEVRIDSLLFMSIVDTLSEPGQAMLSGVKSFKENRFDEAIENFKKVLLSYPSGDVAARCLYDIGVCFMKLGNYSAAENKFQQVLSHHRSHPLASQSLFLKAMSYYERHESPQAEKLFRKFIQKHRDHKWTGKAYEKLGDVYTDMMQDKKAVDAYSHAADVARSPLDGVHSLYKLGNAYLKIGNETRAIEAFQKGIVLGERKGIKSRPVPDSYYQIADCYYKKKDFSKALDYYKKAAQKYFTHPDTPWGLFQIASIYKNTKKYDKSIKTFNKLINEYPDDYWARQAQWKLEDAIWEYEYRAVLK